MPFYIWIIVWFYKIFHLYYFLRFSQLPTTQWVKSLVSQMRKWNQIKIIKYLSKVTKYCSIWLLSRKILLLLLSQLWLVLIVVSAYAEIDLQQFYSLEDLRRGKVMRWKGTSYVWLPIFRFAYAVLSSKRKKEWEKTGPLLTHALLYELEKRQPLLGRCSTWLMHGIIELLASWPWTWPIYLTVHSNLSKWWEKDGYGRDYRFYSR